MRWFGNSWNLNMCRADNRTEWSRVPEACRVCLLCKKAISEEQGGLLIPYVGEEVTVKGWHYWCLAASCGVQS